MSEEEGITVSKSENFSEWFTQVVFRGELADVRYGVQGFIVHMPWAFRILREIYRLLEEDVEEDGHEPFLFPTVIPEKSLMKEKEHAGFAPDVFWVTRQGEHDMEEPVALRPTGETALYPMYSLWIRSYKDLPFKRYQSRITVFRNEKVTRPFLRGREFMFFETHDVFRTHEEALTQIRRDMKTMDNVAWGMLKLPSIFMQRPQWDKFKGADNTYASDTIMPDGKRNQMSSTHDLGHNFARAYDIKFIDDDGREKYGWQTCFGPGVWRIMAALIGIHGDDHGLVLPTIVAPLQAVIVPIYFAEKAEQATAIRAYCLEIRKMLKGEMRIGFDDSENTPGYKYNHWELRGVPLRIEIGPKELETKAITIVRRTDKKREKAGVKNAVHEVKRQLAMVDTQIEERAQQYFLNNTKSAESFDELKTIIEEFRGFVKVPFCSMGMDGEECASKIKEETTADVCGIPFYDPETLENKKCIVCRREAKIIAYVTKSY